MAWSAVGKFSQFGISFITGTILARLLMPSDYGLVGMLAIFLVISNLFIASGFSSALIQKANRTETDYSTIFYFNVAVALLFYVVLFFCAPLIAQFYKIDQLVALTRVMTLIIVINSLSLVQQTRLTIQLAFKTQAIIAIVSSVLSGLLGIFAAYYGLGVWALVVQSISMAAIALVAYYYVSFWTPMLVFSIDSFKKLFGFSSKLLIAGIVANIFTNIYLVLIGKLFSAKDLGFYTRAKQYPELLSNTITGALQGVTFPIMSSLQDDKERLISVYDRLMGMTVFFVIPLLTLFALVTEPFIRLLLTEKWMPVVPLMQWLCFARMITPISALNMNILNVIGRSDLYMKVDLSKLSFTVIILVVTVPFGLKHVVIGHFVASFIAFFFNAYYPGKFFGYGAIRQIKEMKWVVLSTLLMAAMVYGLLQVLPGDFLKLAIGTPFGIGVYAMFAYLFKIKEINDVTQIFVSLTNKYRNKIHKSGTTQV